MSKRITTTIPRYGSCEVYEESDLNSGKHDSEFVEMEVDISGKSVLCRALFPKKRFFVMMNDGTMLMSFHGDCLVEIKTPEKTEWMIRKIQKTIKRNERKTD